MGPLDALSGITLDFTNAQIGLLGSAHFFGFFIGCWWAPRLMGTIGHSRAFAAFTAAGAIGLLAHMLVIDPYAWALMRVASGLCVAGCYTVIEAWLQAKVTNETRGRAMGTYRVVDMGASLVAQMLICGARTCLLCLLQPAGAAVLRRAPADDADPHRRARNPDRPAPAPDAGRDPLAAGRRGRGGRGPVQRVLPHGRAGLWAGRRPGGGSDRLFSGGFRAGGALAQYPVGWLADKYDRRWVLIWLSVASIASSALTALTGDLGTVGVLLTATLFGPTTFPIYSVAAAHAHDFADTSERVELSAALMFFFALGAIAAPLLASILIEVYGPSAMFIMIGTGHAVLVVFGLIRMRMRPRAARRTPYVWAPRTSFLIGRLTGRARDED